MHKTQNNIIKKDLVLLGAGHSNIEVIRYLGKQKLKGLRITLVSNDTYTTYSGMVPGYIEGKYNWNEINIDLIKLCYKNNIKIVIAEVSRISGKQNKVFLKKRPPIEFDILSVNLGIRSNTEDIIGAEKYALPLKPISQVNKTLKSILNNKSKNIAIIGAGAAGVEVSLALNKRFKEMNIKKNIILISKNILLMNNYSFNVSKIVEKELTNNNIKLLCDSKVTKIKKDYIEINNTKKILTSCSILATNAASLDILKKSDLKLSKNRFISVSPSLQSLNHNNIFASGDNADIENYKLVKAGIFAVKQAKVLKINLKKFFLQKPLEYYYPQKSYLSLIGITNERAIANKSIITLKGMLFWKLKKYIDKKFINKYSYIKTEKIRSSNQTESIEPIDHKMQCDGCGSKVPQYIIKDIFASNLKFGSYDADMISDTKNLLHTVDIITSLIDDQYLMGRIAAKHSLNDLYAANSFPLSIQMIIGITKSLSTIQKRDIYQIKEGALSVFNELNIPINGGHTYSIDEEKNTIGFSLVGKRNKKINNFTNNRGKQKIYMTGKIGTALVMAALKQNIISGKYYKEVITVMTKSNLSVYKFFKRNNISNITDISGFGLALHLNNLLIRNKNFKGANIYLDKILILEGAKKAIKNNIKSSLADSNKSSLNNNLEVKTKNKTFLNILFDPQTAGGFLFITSDKNIILDLRKNNIMFSEIGNITSDHNKIRIL